MKFEEYSRTFLHFYTTEIPVLLKKILPVPKGVLADLGAGDGALLIALKTGGYLDGTAIVAVDISPERCARLSECSDIKVFCSDVTSVSGLASNSVDVVICTQVIEHVDEGKLLSEIFRVLKKDGKLYIASLVKKWYGWWYYRTKDGKWALDPTHLREYSSLEQFASTISAGGFELDDTQISALKLSIPEFIVRRLFAPMFPKTNFNSVFLKVRALDWIRRKFCLHPPGYFIVEGLARKP